MLIRMIQNVNPFVIVENTVAKKTTKNHAGRHKAKGIIGFA